MAMTLAEMLALLPDNDKGEIGADDLRTIVTELFNTSAANAAAIDLNQTAIVELQNGLATTNTNFDSLFQWVQQIDARVTALEQAP